MNTQVDYYRDQRVRQAMCSFLDGCEYIVGFGEAQVWRGAPVPFYSAPAGWPHLEIMLESGLDVFASLWRQNCTVGVVDIEYYNHLWKGKAITDPGYAMWAVRPVVEQYLFEFARLGMPFLGLVTGQGVQLLFKVPFADPVHDRLVHLGQFNEWTLQQQYERDFDGKRTRQVPWIASVGSRGMFRAELKISNDVLKGLAARRDFGEHIIPVVYSDIHMGDPGFGLEGNGPEGVSIDLTCFGDPLHMRDHRAPFSTHQKQRADLRYTDVYWAPLKITLPFWDMDHYDSIAVKRIEEVQFGETDYGYAAAIADSLDCSIPTASWAISRVIDEIEAGPLGAFFAYFDEQHHNYEQDWPDTYYNPALLEKLPPCVRFCLEYPEPHLLRPTNLQRLVRVLDAMGWHPKHIGGLIYSRYRHLPWDQYNPEKRANYWAEQYAAPIHDGTDTKAFMSCEEEQIRGFCVQPWSGFDLRWYK